MGLEFAVWEVRGLTVLNDGNNVVEGVGDEMKEVEGERVRGSSTAGELGGEIRERTQRRNREER